jgi:hypothetical protein
MTWERFFLVNMSGINQARFTKPLRQNHGNPAFLCKLSEVAVFLRKGVTH